MPEVPDPGKPAIDTNQPYEDDPGDLGCAVEDFITRTEQMGYSPDIEIFLREYPQLGDELRSALEGLSVVRGLLSSGGSSTRDNALVEESSLHSQELQAGFGLAGYRIVRELGRGGMGVVYEAMHVDLDRPVALKVLKPWSGGSAKRRFLNEARTAAALHHTNIVPVFDVGQSGSTTYYAMQKIDGEGLDHLIHRLRGECPVERATHISAKVTHRVQKSDAETKISLQSPHNVIEENSALHLLQTGKVVEQIEDADGEKTKDRKSRSFVLPSSIDTHDYARWVAEVGIQASLALDYAHKRQVIHRDIKPSNLILDKSGTIWVADFGLALRLDDPGLSRGDGVLGTPRYTSPEQAARKVVDHRTDIYSLGATLYELVCLRPPFDGESSDEVIRKILTESPVAPRVVNANVSRDLETIILKAMARRPEDRYATGQELAEDLGRYLNYEPVLARRIGPIGRTWRLMQRHPALTLVTTTAAALIIGITAFSYRRVLLERDDALAARTATLAALEGEKNALMKARSAMRNQLWREATLVRLSAVPDRRQTILELIQEAATYDPGPGLKAKLRDEIVQALSLSDVRPEAALPVSSNVAGFEIVTDQQRAVTLSKDQKKLTIWDLSNRNKHAEVALENLFNDGANEATRKATGLDRSSPEPRRDIQVPGGLLSRRTPRIMITIGSTVGVVRPDRRGILWIDSETAEPRGEWQCPGNGTLIAVQPIGGKSPRILTIEYFPGKRVESTGGMRGMSFGTLGPEDELKICVYDLEKQDLAPLVLDRIEGSPDRGRINWPVLAISPEGEWIALGRLFDDQIRIMSLSDGKELGTFSAQVPVTSIAAGPERLLGVAGGGSIHLWRNELKKENQGPSWSVTQLPSLATNLGHIRQIRFSPSRNVIAASGRVSGIELWDFDSGQPVASLATKGQVDHMSFSPSGGILIASTGNLEDGSLLAWSINKPLVRQVVAKAPEPIASLSLYQDSASKRIFAHSLIGQVWSNTVDQTELKRLRVGTEGVTRFGALRTDSAGRLWGLMDRTVQRWDHWTADLMLPVEPSSRFSLDESGDGGWMMRGFGLTRMPSGLVFSSQSPRIFTSRGSMLYLMDPSVNTSFVPIILEVDKFQANQAEFESAPRKTDSYRDRERRDGRGFGGGDESRSRDRDRPLPSARPSEPLASLPPFRTPTPFSKRLNVSPDGNKLVILRGNSWEFWEVDSLVKSGSGSIWKAKRKSLPAEAPTTDVTAIAMSPDGSTLAVAQQDSTVTIIDVPTWRVTNKVDCRTESDNPIDMISDMSFMPGDRNFLALSSQRSLSIWCLEGTMQRYVSVPVNNPSVTPIVWEKNGDAIYLVEDDNQIVRWDFKKILQAINQMNLN